ncbi:unnamed protein product [Caenorhabditis sp. 36 PRJEB53466]|nr:unnamed protein product [Caenorhabditis sp. 36 PRJEB53466]
MSENVPTPILVHDPEMLKRLLLGSDDDSFLDSDDDKSEDSQETPGTSTDDAREEHKKSTRGSTTRRDVTMDLFHDDVLTDKAKVQLAILAETDPKTRALLEEMYDDTPQHECVYPPVHNPNSILIPTGRLARCQCSPNCDMELNEPEYKVMDSKEDRARWDPDYEENKKGKSNKRQQKKKNK